MKSGSSRKVLKVVQSHASESGLGVGRESTSQPLNRLGCPYNFMLYA
jgi:hypothetical protein